MKGPGANAWHKDVARGIPWKRCLRAGWRPFTWSSSGPVFRHGHGKMMIPAFALLVHYFVGAKRQRAAGSLI